MSRKRRFYIRQSPAESATIRENWYTDGKLKPIRDGCSTQQRDETERFRRYTYDALTQGYKANLDIFWLGDESVEVSENLPPPDQIAEEIMEDAGHVGAAGVNRGRIWGRTRWWLTSQQQLTDDFSVWARQMIMLLRRWLPNRQLVLVGDNGYAVLDLLHCCQSLREPDTLIARLRLDAVLYAPAPPRQQGQNG